ncbi:MAG: zinc ribbon domain-containing protein [Candidatus Heimdallarchaeota archaeon]|nr:zinc ribbon domain-containing protein [Candidatus Heimdallarchaeota archaeon]
MSLRILAQDPNEIQNSTITYDVIMNTEAWVDESCGIVSPTSYQYYSTLNITKLPSIRESWSWEASLIARGGFPNTLNIKNTTISVDMESMRYSTQRLLEMPVEIYFECIEFQDIWNLFPYFLLISTQESWLENFTDSILSANIYQNYGVSTPWYKLAAVWGLDTTWSTGWIEITEPPSSKGYEELNSASISEILLISTFRGDLSSEYEQYGNTRNPNLKINNDLQIEFKNGWLNGMVLSIDIDGNLDSDEIRKKLTWSIIRRDGTFSPQKIDDRLDWFLVFVLNNLILAFAVFIVGLVVIFIIILKLAKRVTKEAIFIICQNCDHKIESGSYFCDKCGRKLNPMIQESSTEA